MKSRLPKKLLLTAALMCGLTSAAHAQAPDDIPRLETRAVAAEQIVVSLGQMTELQNRLEFAVFPAYSTRPREFELQAAEMEFDGAAVAVMPEDVREILPKKPTAVPEQQAELPKSAPAHPTSHSFFSNDLENVSSPFHKKAESKTVYNDSRQYFLTTADWLTFSESFEVELFGQKVPATLEYRDDQQNLAVLSTKRDPRVRPVKIIAPDQPIPQTVFVLLSPGSIFESLTQHVLSISEMHLYGSADLTARNGYPIFSIDGDLAGLSVGPTTSQKNTSVVHPGLIDRALHPQKYSNIIREEIKLQEY